MMDCLHAMAPHEEEILGFALDEKPLSVSTRTHLEQCEICQKRLANFKQLNRTLLAQMYRRFCPSGMQLSMYCEGLLLPDEMRPIAFHLRECPLCAAEVADTRRFMEAASLDTIVVPFSPHEGVPRVVARLVHQQVQQVTRGREDMAGKGWLRQYRADSIDLSLYLSDASSGGYMLRGILTSADNQESVDAFEGARAELYTTTDAEKAEEESIEPLYQEIVDDRGNIVFTLVPVGSYTLMLHLPEQKVVIEDITIEYR
jgi:hypothetical protein